LNLNKILLFESFSEKSKIIKDIEDQFYVIEEFGYLIKFVEKDSDDWLLHDDDPCDIVVFIRMSSEEFTNLRDKYSNEILKLRSGNVDECRKLRKRVEYFARLLEDQLNDIDDKFYDVKVDFVMCGNVASVVKIYLQ
jgi:hypothetical protein